MVLRTVWVVTSIGSCFAISPRLTLGSLRIMLVMTRSSRWFIFRGRPGDFFVSKVPRSLYLLMTDRTVRSLTLSSAEIAPAFFWALCIPIICPCTSRGSVMADRNEGEEEEEVGLLAKL
ncbi:hypothetical protein BC939DRAFT_111451 [Gamsiella multidivaricata]|uniref:uncharacterized protein n=1 Tax=Gamsiella multidivaricata TaxID=101098 RepID=UPI00221F3578|nr:uncharacterized protein BC939DRAFT_111451 [Gamsiella multidivaricata]KAI7826502.1 hypothetical protein BC939DRAFT_111451 [Gamsiella multidivaricata]